MDSLDHVLDVVHDRVLRPILLAGRAIAFGFIIVAGLDRAVLVALVIGLIRLMNVYLFAGHEWLTYLVRRSASRSSPAWSSGDGAAP